MEEEVFIGPEDDEEEAEEEERMQREKEEADREMAHQVKHGIEELAREGALDGGPLEDEQRSVEEEDWRREEMQAYKAEEEQRALDRIREEHFKETDSDC